MRIKRATIVVASLLASCAWASPVNPNRAQFRLSGVGGATDPSHSVYVYPYYLQISGAGLQGSNFVVACDSYLNETYIGESWSGTVNTFATLQNAKYGNAPQAQQKYAQAAWLMMQFGAHPGDASDINFAIWALFQPQAVSSTSGFDAKSRKYLSESSLAGNLAQVDERNYLVLTPDADPNNPYAGPQEYLLFDEGKGATYVPPAAVPEPDTLALLGMGIVGGVSALRRRKALTEQS